MFNVGDKVTVNGNYPADPFYEGLVGVILPKDPDFINGYVVKFPDKEARFYGHELDLVKEEISIVNIRAYILEIQAHLAMALFLCEVEDVGEIKEEFRKANYALRDVMEVI